MSTPPNKKVSCPQCGKSVPWKNNPHRPFCSDRCKLLDLSAWASGDYKIDSQADESASDDHEDI